jgi:plastocyanin
MKNITLTTLGVIVAVGIAVAVFYAANQYLNAHAEPQATCSQQGETHVVTIKAGKLSPTETNAQRCDILTITNTDDTLRNMAFGVHDRHVTYDGITERVLKKGESLTVTLKQTGHYTFHDHLHEAVAGSVTVSD